MSIDPKKTYIPDRTDKPFPGLVVDWYNHDEVIVYKLTTVTEAVVQKWAALVMAILKTWPKNQPYLAVHDLSQSGVSLQYAAIVNFDMMNIGVTLGGRAQVERFFDNHRGWSARVAVNFNLSLSGQTNRTLMAYLSENHPAVQYKAFYNRSKCLRWLTTGITDTSEMRAVEDQNADKDV